MSLRKRIQPNEKVPLKLTAVERTLVREEITFIDVQYEQIIQRAPAGKPVMMTLDDLVPPGRIDIP